MTRFILITVLLTFITGCVSTFRSFPGYGTSDTIRFSNGVKKLEADGDPALLKKMATDQPDSSWGESARLILKAYTAQQKKIETLKDKNNSLVQENKQLKSNLDKLNKINLEMEKRSP